MNLRNCWLWKEFKKFLQKCFSVIIQSWPGIMKNFLQNIRLDSSRRLMTRVFMCRMLIEIESLPVNHIFSLRSSKRRRKTTQIQPQIVTLSNFVFVLRLATVLRDRYNSSSNKNDSRWFSLWSQFVPMFTLFVEISTKSLSAQCKCKMTPKREGTWKAGNQN